MYPTPAAPSPNSTPAAQPRLGHGAVTTPASAPQKWTTFGVPNASITSIFARRPWPAISAMPTNRMPTSAPAADPTTS